MPTSCLAVLTWMALALTPVAAWPANGAVKHFEIHQDPKPHPLQTGFKPEHPDRGYVRDCATEGSYYNISWSPKTMDPSSQVTIFVDFVSSIDFSRGRAQTTILNEGSLFYKSDLKIDCQQVAQDVKGNTYGFSGFQLVCPIRKGTRLQGVATLFNQERARGFSGHYKVQVRLENEKHESLCLELEMEFLSDYDYDY